MPRVNGFDVLRNIRSRPQFQSAPVVSILSSSEAVADLARSKELGANSWLSKQSGIAPFVQAINNKFANR